MNMEFHIKKYQIEDHHDVKRIFYEGQTTQLSNGIKLVLKNPKLILAFMLGAIQSFSMGLLLLISCVLIQCLGIILIFKLYAR